MNKMNIEKVFRAAKTIQTMVEAYDDFNFEDLAKLHPDLAEMFKSNYDLLRWIHSDLVGSCEVKH